MLFADKRDLNPVEAESEEVKILKNKTKGGPIRNWHNDFKKL